MFLQLLYRHISVDLLLLMKGAFCTQHVHEIIRKYMWKCLLTYESLYMCAGISTFRAAQLATPFAWSSRAGEPLPFTDAFLCKHEWVNKYGITLLQYNINKVVCHTTKQERGMGAFSDQIRHYGKYSSLPIKFWEWVVEMGHGSVGVGQSSNLSWAQKEFNDIPSVVSSYIRPAQCADRHNIRLCLNVAQLGFPLREITFPPSLPLSLVVPSLVP